jgi:hypothetical protein
MGAATMSRKDIREWVASQELDLNCADEWDEAGHRLLKELRPQEMAESPHMCNGSVQGAPVFDAPPRTISTELLPVPYLDVALIPPPLRDWLSDIAERGCFPLEYPVAAAIVALSALVGRRIGIRPKQYDNWLVVPNLWGAVVGPPGIQKTPAVDEGMLPLRRLVADALKAHEELSRQHILDSLVAKARTDASRDALKKAARDSSKTEEELRELVLQRGFR